MRDITKHGHTPGPWMHYNAKGHGQNLKNHYIKGRYDKVAIIARNSCAECEALNAALISTAPELLEACQTVLNGLENMLTVDFSIGADKPLRDMLRAVINKATGAV